MSSFRLNMLNAIQILFTNSNWQWVTVVQPGTNDWARVVTGSKPVFATSDIKDGRMWRNARRCKLQFLTVSHMLIEHQRTVQNHTQDFQFVSRGYCAASNGDSLWKLWDAQTLSGPDVHNFRFVRIQ